eukprot:scaffold69813_cov15-Prasinocladus_malaysianus.AAC.2
MVYCSRSAEGVASPNALQESYLTVFTDAGGVFTLSLPQTIDKPLGEKLQEELTTTKNQLAMLASAVAGLPDELLAQESELRTDLESMGSTITSDFAALQSQVNTKTSMTEVFNWIENNCHIDIDGHDGGGTLGGWRDYPGVASVIFNGAWDSIGFIGNVNDGDKLYIRAWCDTTW